MLKYWVWLSELKGLRNLTKLALLRRFGDPESIFYADPDELMLTEGADPGQLKLLENHDLAPADKILADCQRLDIQLLTFSDAAYPGRLKNIYDPPALLYYKGKLPLLDDLLSVAVVGTRDCTPYGVACAEKLGFGLASGGAVVVSGLAKGIDAAATRGALRAGGVTIGVAGNGLDVHYPYESRYLYEDVAASGVLFSEYPPGTEPAPGHFPVRNRILSGLSLAALVVEAPERSGALITAMTALEQGRDVFAVPGPIDAPTSVGCNRLIRQGAGILLSPKEFLEDLGVLTKEQTSENLVKFIPGQEEKKKMLESRENLVYSSLCLYPKSLNQIVEDTCLSAREVVCSLVSLEMQGLAEEISKNFYIRK